MNIDWSLKVFSLLLFCLPFTSATNCVHGLLLFINYRDSLLKHHIAHFLMVPNMNNYNYSLMFTINPYDLLCLIFSSSHIPISLENFSWKFVESAMKMKKKIVLSKEKKKCNNFVSLCIHFILFFHPALVQDVCLIIMNN